MSWEIREGDCIEQMRAMEENLIDAVVCDPPYGIGFMGHEWDQPGKHGPIASNGRPEPFGASISRKRRRERHPPATHGAGHAREAAAANGEPPKPDAMQAGRYDLSPIANQRFQAWCEAWAREAYRVLKPGGHLLAFGGTRTFHRLTCAIEDAGFEIRDCLNWLYGSGFPKSRDVSKAIDRQRDDSRRRGDVAEWLRPYVEAFGFDRLSEHFGFQDQTMARARWTTRSQTRTPTVAQWAELRWLLNLPDNMDEEVRQLNGLKGKPGDAWQKREIIQEREMTQGGGNALHLREGELRTVRADITAPATADAERWEGWGTALKPAHEPIVVARKPLAGTVVANVLEHGTGALNIDGCRVAHATVNSGNLADNPQLRGRHKAGTEQFVPGGESRKATREFESDPSGRWPANLILSHTEDCVLVGDQAAELWACVPGCPVRMLDEQSGQLQSGSGNLKRNADKFRSTYGAFAGGDESADVLYGDRGGASRFFYCAKASRAERNAGLDAFEKRPINWSSGEQNPGSFQSEGTEKAARNPHPTVKPIELMRWLVRLVTPPGGLVLDPFTGSGTTGCAAVLEGFDFIGIEREAKYIAIAEARIGWWAEHPEGVETAKVYAAERKRAETAAAGQAGLFDEAVA